MVKRDVYQPEDEPVGNSAGAAPDGSIIGGDPAAGWRVSSDLRTFQDAAYADILDDQYVGDLFARGAGAHLEVSRDRVNSLSFSPAAARTLLR